MTANGGSQVGVGDTVEVPGGMFGVVRYIGNVQGKNGVFAGVELTKEFASRGKNDGDVDGVSYFATTVPGAGIFLPAHRAAKQESPIIPASSFPPTPTTPSHANFDLAHRNAGIPNSSTPPTPSMSKFSRSVGPGSRPNFSQSVGPGASPAIRPKQRSSIGRPESPLRKAALPPQSGPTPRRTSAGVIASSRGPRPSTIGASITPVKLANATPRPAGQARSPSRTNSHLQDYSPITEDTDSTPTPSMTRMSNGLSATMRSRQRPASSGQNSAEVQQLKDRLGERDRQLKEQAASLADMEKSLGELQNLMQNGGMNGGLRSPAADAEEHDASQLRALLREKNERIATLMTEFDSHRADFRSTIDTLEMASTETERVYEKRVDELVHEVAELRGRSQDVEIVARQISQLEELVQELEEGLEDARRGEAEARGEVEFLRGEVERSRSELKRERDKAVAALKDADAAIGERSLGPTSPGGSQALEQRDDEIRGLKAIIHSLSSGNDAGSPGSEKQEEIDAGADQESMAQLKVSMEQLQREKSELQGLVERKSFREEELERELNRLRSINGNGGPTMRDSVISNNRQSVKTVVTADGRPFSHHSGKLSSRLSSEALQKNAIRNKDTTLPPTEESISSSVTSETLWCEICETAGHDILTCHDIGSHTSDADPSTARLQRLPTSSDKTSTPSNAISQNLTTTTLDRRSSPSNGDTPTPRPFQYANKDTTDVPRNNGTTPTPARRASSREEPSRPPAEAPKPPEGDGPAAGKASGFIDMSKWCAMCERDGHESVDCPFEEEY